MGQPGRVARGAQATGVRAEALPGVQAIEVLAVVPEAQVVSEVPAAVVSDLPVVEDPVAEVVPEVVVEADNNYINRHLK